MQILDLTWNRTISYHTFFSLSGRGMSMLFHKVATISGGLMYAIIETGGKQYRVEKGDVIDVEY